MVFGAVLLLVVILRHYLKSIKAFQLHGLSWPLASCTILSPDECQEILSHIPCAKLDQGQRKTKKMSSKTIVFDESWTIPTLQPEF